MTFRLTSRGFTLIELLVVIAIIGLLSTLAVVSLNSARAKARDAKRMHDLQQLQKAVQLYYDAHDQTYPSTGGAWWGVTSAYGSHGTSGANGYIPNVAPAYIPALPTDPSGSTVGGREYLYNSNGADYKILVHSTVETGYPANHPFYDPARPTWAWQVSSSGAVAW